MDEYASLEHELTEQLLEALRALPRADDVVMRPAEERARDGRRHAEIGLILNGRPVALVVETKKSIFPRDIREASWQLSKYVTRDAVRLHEGVPVPLLAAQTISPGAKDLLKQEGIGFFDSGGSLYIPGASFYVYIEKPPPKALAKSVRSLFRGKRSQVLLALLHRQNDWFGVNDLADLAQVSMTTVSETLSELERFEWVVARGQGPAKERRVERPGTILDDWAKYVSINRQSGARRFYVSNARGEGLSDRIDAVCAHRHLRYVFTQEAAAQRYAPYLTNVSRISCRMPPGRLTDEAMQELGAREVSEGANLVVIESPGEGEFLFKERVGEVWLANPVQVYLDLIGQEGRAKEMAEHLRKERIGF